MDYGAIILDNLSYMPQEAIPFLKVLAGNGRLIIRSDSEFASLFKGSLVYKTPDDLISEINKIISNDLILSPPSKNIRYRHVTKGDDHYYIIFNEEASGVTTKIKIPASGNRQFLDPSIADAVSVDKDKNVHFKPHKLKILRIKNYF